MYPRRLLREECWWWIDYLSLIHVDSFQGEQMMYMGGKNKLNKKDLQIHESNRYFHPIFDNAILIELWRNLDLTHLIYVFCISNGNHTIRYDISKQKTSTFENWSVNEKYFRYTSIWSPLKNKTHDFILAVGEIGKTYL